MNVVLYSGVYEGRLVFLMILLCLFGAFAIPSN
jgi:hypothetical protein